MNRGDFLGPINSLYESHDFHHWHKLFPDESKYVSFKPNIIYALNKVDDVYYAFAKARQTLHMTEIDNYGHLVAKDDALHRNNIKTIFFESALSYYNFAIDLSWQVMFYYVSDSSLYFFAKNEIYIKYANRCNIISLMENLNYQKQYSLYEVLQRFWKNPIVMEIRELYNLLKHRGALHTKGLGTQYDSPIFNIKYDGTDITFDLFTKRELDLPEVIQKLVEFDKEFYNYFEHILSLIVPNDFLGSSATFESTMDFSLELYNFKNDELAEYDRRFKAFYDI